MNYKDTSDHAINAFGIKTQYSSTGMWTFAENTGDILRLYTMESVQWSQFWKVITNMKSIIFHVSANAEAHVLLSRDVGNTDGDSSYRISLGGTQNTVSGISQGAYAPWKVKVQTKGILSSVYDRTFWISWYLGTIKVGYGNLVDRNTFMFFKDNASFPIRAASVTTAEGNTGAWRIQDNLEPENYVFTPPKVDREYNHFWVEAPKTQAMKFSVVACSDVSLVLCTVKESLTDDSIEVVLNNTKSAIKFPYEAGNIVDVATPNILSCFDSRDFWITWKDNTIKVGLGVIYGEEQQMQWKDLGHVINAVSITTSNKQPGFWTISESAGQRVAVQTDTTYAYNFWRSVRGELYTTFKVRACNDAHILLSNNKGRNNTQIYEIVIGGWNNQKSLIRDKRLSSDIKVVNTPNIMNCTNGRHYWVAWDGTDITVGRGKVYGQAKIMSAFKTQWFTVNYFSISTGWKATGDWRFDEDVGDMYTLYTGKIKEYGQNWLQLKQSTTSISFDVQACSDAHIILATDKDKLQTNVIEVVIGGMQNSQSEIRIEMGGEPIKTVIVKDLLDCVTQWRFWISWADGQIRVGRSHVFGQGKFLEYSDSRKIDVYYASFSTGGVNAGWWSVTEFLGQQWYLRTTEMPGKVQQLIWRSVEHRRSVVFSVKGCSDAKVVLTPAMGFISQARYVFIIGGWKNSMSAIRRPGTPYDPLVVQRVTPGILDCDKFRDFWIAWYNGVLAFGQGKTVGKNLVLNYQDLAPSVIKALQFKTPLRITADWVFPSDDLIPPEPPVTEGPIPTVNPSPPGPPKFDLSPGQKAGIVLGVIGLVGLMVVIAFFGASWIKKKRSPAEPTQQNRFSIQLPPSIRSRLESRRSESKGEPLEEA